jgi:hypothetical protein
MRKTLKKAKTPESVAPAPEEIPVASAADPAADPAPAPAHAGAQAEPVVVPRPMTAPEAENAAAADGKGDKGGKSTKAAKPAKPRTRAARQPPPEPVESLAGVRAELADLTTRIEHERQVRCLPGQDFPLDTATGRLIKADIERLRGIDPGSVTGAGTLPYFVELRNVCRRLLAEVCFGDSLSRRQTPGRAASNVGRQMMAREHFTCLDGPTAPPPSPDEAASL